MTFSVYETDAVAKVVDGLRGKRKTEYKRTVKELKHTGCAAGGKRLAEVGGGDTQFCQRSVYDTLRMITVFIDGDIFVIGLGEHDGDSGPVQQLADIVPTVSAIGRRRQEQPKCCSAPAAPPELGDFERELLGL